MEGLFFTIAGITAFCLVMGFGGFLAWLFNLDDEEF
jgi:hypothetical protein